MPAAATRAFGAASSAGWGGRYMGGESGSSAKARRPKARSDGRSPQLPQGRRNGAPGVPHVGHRIVSGSACGSGAVKGGGAPPNLRAAQPPPSRWTRNVFVDASVDQCGITDVLTKAYGSTSPKNLVKATMDALRRLQSREQVEGIRGVQLEKGAGELVAR